MHNLKANYDKFYELIKQNFSTMLTTKGNFQEYPNSPKMSDISIIALSLSAEAIGIDSENYLWNKLKGEHRDDFPNLIDRTRFNRRRKKLASYTKLINEKMAACMTQGEARFLVDSMPIPVCHIAREKRSKICKEIFYSAPDKGYSAVNKSYYYGYKLHLLISACGVYHSMDMTKASVHDIHYLTDIKQSSLRNFTLIGDKGYLSVEQQVDLFTSCNIRLSTPHRKNQKNFIPFPAFFRKSRKRIETLFSQLCDQFMIKRNYAKTYAGVAVRILSKITAVTLLQFLNLIHEKPINHLKYALCF